MIHRFFFAAWLVCLLAMNCAPTTQTAVTSVSAWVTSADQSQLLAEQTIPFHAHPEPDLPSIKIDTGQHYQPIEGFGFSLTGGSASLIHQLNTMERKKLLTELFSPDGLGVSYLRISIGASDLDPVVFSYDDLPPGTTDPELAYFSLARDTQDLIPVLREILEIRPDLKIMGSPWSPPAWMKTNGESKGGHLKLEFYPTYAQYFVRYLSDMETRGIHLDAITIQNEPEHGGNNPSMLMTAGEQTDFIKNDLGPAFRVAGLTTKIVIWDHNCDHPEYPLRILKDPDANSFVEGAAFHMYAGDATALGQVNTAFPDKSLYFTEQWTGANGQFGGDFQWHVKNILIGTMQNWSRVVLEWNLASDPAYEPHTPGGCTECKGALTIDGSRIIRNVSYYIIGQVARFVPPGSVRIHCEGINHLSYVAFRRPDREIALLVLNEDSMAVQFSVTDGNTFFTAELPAHAAGTFVW